MTDEQVREQFESEFNKAVDEQGHPPVVVAWTLFQTNIEHARADERRKVIAEVMQAVPKWIDNPYGENLYAQGRKDERLELRAKLREMGGE